ncbi:MAG: hypothetical protein IJR03_01990 [Bacteroidales bacterium]|nr:hypothetical protein [Bacteroidales bacterium]
MKRINLLVAVLLVLILFCSCNKEKKIAKTVIEYEVEKLNAQCPMPVSEDVTMTSVLYHKDTVIYKFMLENQLKMHSTDNIKRSALLLARTKESKEWMQKLYKNKIVLKCIYTTKDGSKKTITISPKEIDNMLNQAISDRQAKEMILSIQMENLKNSLPKVVEEGITIVDMKLNEHYLTYITRVDENSINISLLNANKQEVKNVMKDNLKNSLSGEKRQMKLLTDTKRGIAYKFFGNKTKKTCIITFSTEEINKIIQ